MRQLSGGSTPPKYLTDIHPSNFLGVYTPKTFDGHTSVTYFGGLTHEIFDGCMSVKYLTHAHASVVWGVYTPKIFDGHTSVKYLGGLHPLNI